MDIERIISKKIGKALFEYHMIEENDKILVAISGGKDSLCLLHHLSRKKDVLPCHFTIGAVHIHSEFCTCEDISALTSLFASWDVDRVNVGVQKRLKPGRSMNCYWCSTQRRMELLNYARDHGYTKIALGHHLDDILETFFINMMYKSELSTMLPVLRYDKYPITVIRPLALVKEKEIEAFVQKLGFDSITCSCPFGENSKRKKVRAAIEYIVGSSDFLKDNIYRAMGNPVLRYLPTPTDADQVPSERNV